MKAADIMTTRVVTVAPDASVQEIARVLLDNAISAVPVVDADGGLRGIVSEGDLIRRVETDTETPPPGGPICSPCRPSSRSGSSSRTAAGPRT